MSKKTIHICDHCGKESDSDDEWYVLNEIHTYVVNGGSDKIKKLELQDYCTKKCMKEAINKLLT